MAKVESVEVETGEAELGGRMEFERDAVKQPAGKQRMQRPFFGLERRGGSRGACGVYRVVARTSRGRYVLTDWDLHQVAVGDLAQFADAWTFETAESGPRMVELEGRHVAYMGTEYDTVQPSMLTDGSMRRPGGMDDGPQVLRGER